MDTASIYPLNLFYNFLIFISDSYTSRVGSPSNFFRIDILNRFGSVLECILRAAWTSYTKNQIQRSCYNLIITWQDKWFKLITIGRDTLKRTFIQLGKTTKWLINHSGHEKINLSYVQHKCNAISTSKDLLKQLISDWPKVTFISKSRFSFDVTERLIKGFNYTSEVE